MILTVWFTITFVFLNLPHVLSERSSSLGKCKTEMGDVGMCLPSYMCPYAKTNCSESEVCCPFMQKIVTPNLTPRPIIPTTSSPITILPIIEVTTKSPAASVAALKCDEYKHRLKKRASIITYVFGGTASRSKEFPHMAILGYGKPEKIEWLCGGSLISEKFVLTAAHCVITSSVLKDLVRVRLGELDLLSQSDDASPQDFGISKKIVHPNYRPPSQYNDIALLELDREVQFNDYIAPICLQVDRNLQNTNFIATGWGRTEHGGAQSDILMKVNLEYFSNDECQENYELVSTESLSHGIVDDTQICAGSHQEDKDTCQGDSGGPLQIRVDALYLIGITSFGRECGVANSPAVYTRVSYYVPWIEQIVWS